MAISRFSFEDKFRGWKLNEVSFSDFNLFVGQSGVGKTQILSALLSVKEAGIASTQYVNGCEWSIELTINGRNYRWAAETTIRKFGDSVSMDEDEDKNGHARSELPRFIREIITDGAGKEIVRREGAEFEFDGKRLPKLRNTDSAITLLQNEESVAPLYKAFSRFIKSESLGEAVSYGKLGQFENAERLRSQYVLLEDLRAAVGIPLMVRAYILQQNHDAEFQRIKDDFIEIFPTVTDVRLDELGHLSPDLPNSVIFSWALALGIKETGVKGWVVNHQISSGMLRTLTHLIELSLASPDSVIFIDELEYSLGVNCLSEVADHLLRRSDLQFILTSHHPYIINKIPYRYWKLVTRKGSEVRVKDASSIPALNTQTALDRFVVLTNLEEYEEAIK